MLFFFFLFFLYFLSLHLFFFFFFFNDTATTEIYTLSLHDALPIPRWRWLATSLRQEHNRRPFGGSNTTRGRYARDAVRGRQSVADCFSHRLRIGRSFRRTCRGEQGGVLPEQQGGSRAGERDSGRNPEPVPRRRPDPGPPGTGLRDVHRCDHRGLGHGAAERLPRP